MNLDIVPQPRGEAESSDKAAGCGETEGLKSGLSVELGIPGMTNVGCGRKSH